MPSDIDDWADAGPEALIADLLSRPAVTPSPENPDPWGFPAGEDYVAMNTYTSRLLELMAFGPGETGTGLSAPCYNPLQERIAWILQGIVVISIGDVTYFLDLVDHVDLLRRSAFGSYKQLLLDVSTQPGMLKYLTGYQNTKTHPNQNYARELMELFSLGRVHPVTRAELFAVRHPGDCPRPLRLAIRLDHPGDLFQPGELGSGREDLPGAVARQRAAPGGGRRDRLPPLVRLLHPEALLSGDRRPRPDAGDPRAARGSWGPDGDIVSLVGAIASLPEFLSDAAIFSKVKQPVELVAGAARLVGFPGLTDPSLSLSYYLTLLNQHPLMAPNVMGWPRGDQWLGASNLTVWSQLAGRIAVPGLRWDSFSSPNAVAQQIFSDATPPDGRHAGPPPRRPRQREPADLGAPRRLRADRRVDPLAGRLAGLPPAPVAGVPRQLSRPKAPF